MRSCKGCEAAKPITEFYVCSGRPHGNYCKVCYRKRTREAARLRTIKYLFGVTSEQYNAMLDSQGHLCRICGEPDGDGTSMQASRLAVDHCHTTGVVRGLLCYRCNVGLGMFKDRPELLQKAIEYLS